MATYELTLTYDYQKEPLIFKIELNEDTEELLSYLANFCRTVEKIGDLEKNMLGIWQYRHLSNVLGTSHSEAVDKFRNEFAFFMRPKLKLISTDAPNDKINPSEYDDIIDELGLQHTMANVLLNKLQASSKKDHHSFEAITKINDVVCDLEDARAAVFKLAEKKRQKKQK